MNLDDTSVSEGQRQGSKGRTGNVSHGKRYRVSVEESQCARKFTPITPLYLPSLKHPTHLTSPSSLTFAKLSNCLPHTPAPLLLDTEYLLTTAGMAAEHTKHLRCQALPAGPGTDSSEVRRPEHPAQVSMPPYLLAGAALAVVGRVPDDSAERDGEAGGEIAEPGALLKGDDEEGDPLLGPLAKKPRAGLTPPDPPPGRCTLSVLRVGGAAPVDDLNWRREGDVRCGEGGRRESVRPKLGEDGPAALSADVVGVVAAAGAAVR